ncbi:MAG: hypothetical protein MUP33_05680 [Polaromonas sp.]|nr:hypothetical protein [Polaromonas sp.]
MKRFKLHDQSSAPEAAKPLLEGSMQAFGMIPGLHAVMAEAPVVLDAYQKLHALFLPWPWCATVAKSPMPT